MGLFGNYFRIKTGGQVIDLPSPHDYDIDFEKEYKTFTNIFGRIIEYDVKYRLKVELYWKTLTSAQLQSILDYVVNATKPVFYLVDVRYFEVYVDSFSKPFLDETKGLYEGAKLVLKGKNAVKQYPNPDFWHQGNFLINKWGVE